MTEVPRTTESGDEPAIVLIADDEPVIRELVKSVVGSDARMQVLAVTNGREAVEAVAAHRPKLVLLDVRMPLMTGIEACAAIREGETTERAMIVMLSALGEDDDIERAWAAGADDYFLKPFEPEELLERVRDALDLAAA